MITKLIEIFSKDAGFMGMVMLSNTAFCAEIMLGVQKWNWTHIVRWLCTVMIFVTYYKLI